MISTLLPLEKGRRNFKRKLETRRRETDNVEMRARLEIYVNTAASPAPPTSQRESSTRSDFLSAPAIRSILS